MSLESDPSLEELMAEHGPAVARTAALYERDPSERLDLVQEIWLAVWRALPAFRGESSLRTYVFRIAHNCGVNHCTRHRRRDLPVEDVPEPDDPGPSPADRASAQQDMARIQAALRKLPLVDRQIVGLKLEGFANREIAEAAGLTENNVAVRLNRARKRLTTLLEQTA